MLKHKWVIRIIRFHLLFQNLITIGLCSPYNYFSAPLPYLPYYPPSPPIFSCIPCNETCPSIPVNTTKNCSLVGNNVYLVLDPITNSLAIQIAPPTGCSNSTNPRGNPNSTNPGNSTNPESNGSGGAGVCSLMTLIDQLVRSLLDQLRNLLSNLLTSLLKLLRDLLQSLLDPLLGDLNQFLNNTLTDTLVGLGNVVNSTLGGLPGGIPPSTINELLDSVKGLPVLGSSLGPLSEVTKILEDLVGNIQKAVNDLLKNLLDPSLGQSLLPILNQNVTDLLNNTLTSVLDNVDQMMVNDLLNDLLGNNSLTANLTKNLQIVLNDALNNTLCNVEKLLNDTGSLAAVIFDVQKLLDDLLNNLLQDLGKTLDDLLTNLFKKVLNGLLKNLEKLVTDLLNNLLSQKINDMKNNPLMDPNFQNTLMQNLSIDLQKPLANLNLPSPQITPLPGMPDIPVSAFSLNQLGNFSSNFTSLAILPQVLKLLNDTIVNDLQSKLRNLVKGLEVPSGNSTSPIVQGPVSKLLDSVNKLLQAQRNSLMANFKKAVDNKFGNITGILGLQNKTSPVGALVTSLLKDLLGCNLTCTNNSNPNPPSNNTTPPNIPPSSNNTTHPNIPLPYCDPSCFSELLEAYQEAVVCNLRTSAPSASRIVNSQTPVCQDQNDDYYDENSIEELPNQLLQGVYKTIQLTNSLASSALPTFVCCTVQNSNERSGSEIVLPIS